MVRTVKSGGVFKTAPNVSTPSSLDGDFRSVPEKGSGEGGEGEERDDDDEDLFAGGAGGGEAFLAQPFVVIEFGGGLDADAVVDGGVLFPAGVFVGAAFGAGQGAGGDIGAAVGAIEGRFDFHEGSLRRGEWLGKG